MSLTEIGITLDAHHLSTHQMQAIDLPRTSGAGDSRGAVIPEAINFYSRSIPPASMIFCSSLLAEVKARIDLFGAGPAML
ncbi:MAG: hypothetical protein ACN6OY_11825 [Pseudomonas alloputida]